MLYPCSLGEKTMQNACGYGKLVWLDVREDIIMIIGDKDVWKYASHVMYANCSEVGRSRGKRSGNRNGPQCPAL